MRNKFLRRNKDRGGEEAEGRQVNGQGDEAPVTEGDKKHRSRRERHSSNNSDVSPQVRAQVEADDRYYMHRMKAILEAYPTKGPPYDATRVSSHVWMGSQRNADDIPALQRLGITHVLNVAGTRRFDLKRSPYLPGDGIKGFLMIPAEDHDDYDIMKHFPDAIAFLDACREQSGRAFIHCNLGINRSGTICAAYLMISQRQNLLEVVQHLKKKRAVVLCNKNFRRQLVRFARARGLLDPYDPKLDPRTQLREKDSQKKDAQPDDKSFPTSLSAIREMVERPINGYQWKKKNSKTIDEYGILAKGVQLRNLTDSKTTVEKKSETLPRSFSAINKQTIQDNGLRKIATAPGGFGHKRSASWSFSQTPSQPWSRPVTPTSFSRPLTLAASTESLSNEMSDRLNLTGDAEPSQMCGQRRYRRYTRSSSTPIPAVTHSVYSRPRPMVYYESRTPSEEYGGFFHGEGLNTAPEESARPRTYRRYTGSSTSPTILAGRVPPASYSHLYGDNDFAPGEISSVMAMREQLAQASSSRPKSHRSPFIGLLKGRSRRISEHSTSDSTSDAF